MKVSNKVIRSLGYVPRVKSMEEIVYQPTFKPQDNDGRIHVWRYDMQKDREVIHAN